MIRDRAIIIIAVSRYAGAYTDLPGTVESAHRVREWAEDDHPDCGYNVLYLGDDEHEKINVELLTDTISEFLDRNYIDRLMVYFAGHGIARSSGEQFWLLSDAGTTTTEGINVEPFRRGLMKYPFGNHNGDLRSGQLCLIGDACRDTSRDSQEFQGHPIITRNDRKKAVQFDRFLSTELGDASYQINADDFRPAYCVFTDVLLHALWGRAPEAIETEDHRFKPAVTNHSLADYLDSEVERVTARLGTMKPDSVPSVRPPFNYYRSLGQNVDMRTDPRPLAGSLSAIGMSVVGGRARGEAARREITSQDKSFDKRQNQISRAVNELEHRHAQYREGERRFLSVLDFDPERVAIPAQSEVDFDTSDDGMVGIWCSERAGAPVFIWHNNRWVLCPHYPNVYTAIFDDMPGDVLLQERYEKLDTTLSDFMSLRTASRARDAQAYADVVRTGKATFPNRAVTAGYLYEFAADTDNILRTTHYMAKDESRDIYDGYSFGQVIPFDLALLCADALRWNRKNGMWCATADLPSVESLPQNPPGAETRPGYARTSFDIRTGAQLWGMMPVFQQGWMFMATEEHLGVPDALRELGYAAGGRSAASFDEETGQQVFEFFGYKVTER